MSTTVSAESASRGSCASASASRKRCASGAAWIRPAQRESGQDLGGQRRGSRRARGKLDPHLAQLPAVLHQRAQQPLQQRHAEYPQLASGLRGVDPDAQGFVVGFQAVTPGRNVVQGGGRVNAVRVSGPSPADRRGRAVAGVSSLSARVASGADSDEIPVACRAMATDSSLWPSTAPAPSFGFVWRCD